MPHDVGDLNRRNLFDLIDNFEEEDLLEDRREYTVRDLRDAYDLTHEEAHDLHYLIQRKFDPSIGEIRDPCSIPAEIHKEYYEESEHSGFEGFTQNEVVTIMRWYDDMCRYFNHRN